MYAGARATFTSGLNAPDWNRPLSTPGIPHPNSSPIPFHPPLPQPAVPRSFENSFAQIVDSAEEAGFLLAGLRFSRQTQRGSLRLAQRWQREASTIGRSSWGLRPFGLATGGFAGCSRAAGVSVTV